MIAGAVLTAVGGASTITGGMGVGCTLMRSVAIGLSAVRPGNGRNGRVQPQGAQ